MAPGLVSAATAIPPDKVAVSMMRCNFPFMGSYISWLEIRSFVIGSSTFLLAVKVGPPMTMSTSSI